MGSTVLRALARQGHPTSPAEALDLRQSGRCSPACQEGSRTAPDLFADDIRVATQPGGFL